MVKINCLSSSRLQVWYCPNASERPPWPATLAAAIGLFLYQSLDAIDGKQARRTGTSSPLGELFDHGCDSLSTGFPVCHECHHISFLTFSVFVSLASCCALRMGEYPAWLLFQCLTASRLLSLNMLIFLTHSFPSLFYCAHWQTYVSGTLQFGYIDVTEGQIVVMGVMLISSLEDFLDIDIWMSSVSASWK